MRMCILHIFEPEEKKVCLYVECDNKASMIKKKEAQMNIYI